MKLCAYLLFYFFVVVLTKQQQLSKLLSIYQRQVAGSLMRKIQQQQQQYTTIKKKREQNWQRRWNITGVYCHACSEQVTFIIPQFLYTLFYPTICICCFFFVGSCDCLYTGWRGALSWPSVFSMFVYRFYFLCVLSFSIFVRFAMCNEIFFFMC